MYFKHVPLKYVNFSIFIETVPYSNSYFTINFSPLFAGILQLISNQYWYILGHTEILWKAKKLCIFLLSFHYLKLTYKLLISFLNKWFG